jgi:hypothetical protein
VPNAELEEVFAEKLADFLLNSKPALVPLIVFKILDIDKKGLTYERFQQHLAGKLEPKPEEMPSFDAVVSRIYASMDKDSNGRVTNREFTQWLKSFKQAEGAKKFNLAKAEASKNSVRRAVALATGDQALKTGAAGGGNAARGRRSTIFSSFSPVGSQSILVDKAEFTAEQQRERRERRAILKLSAADRAVQTLAETRADLEQVHHPSVVEAVADEVRPCCLGFLRLFVRDAPRLSRLYLPSIHRSPSLFLISFRYHNGLPLIVK